ncbi:MAG: hypothetical protein RL410_1150 [Actinomycetota bacterium]|jgi:putative ABC transport system ATP-binding protein
MQPRISAKNLTLTFGETKALNNASVEVFPGEVLAIMGPSGSGKSTLLHCLAGILTPDSGEVHFDGARVDNQRSAKRDALRMQHFGFVFQFGDLIPELTLKENIALPLMMNGVAKKVAFTRAEHLAEEMDVAEILERTAAEVSGGQAQRTAIARALVTKPAVLFADEPTGSLDSLSGEKVLDILVELARKEGSSVVLVTHAIEVAAVSDREIIIRDGQVVESIRSS